MTDPAAAPPEPSPDTETEAAVRQAARLDSMRAERRALGILAAVAVATIAWITRPVVLGILLGALMAFTVQPAFERIVARTHRPVLLAASLVSAVSLGLLGVLTGLTSLFVTRAMVMAQSLLVALAPEGYLRQLAHQFSSRLGWLKIHPDELSARLHDTAAELASRAASIAGAVATTTFDLTLTLFFAMMTLSLVLQRWTVIIKHVEDMAPLRPRYTRALLGEFQRVGRTTLLGTVLTGLAQGLFAALGYVCAGVPEPLFFGALTAVASVVPGVGTLLVWVPAGLYLYFTGHPIAGAMELLWGACFVVGVSDYVLRPRLVEGQGKMPSLLTFASLFGGVEVFGLPGLLFGPLLMSLSFAVLRIFAQDASERRAAGERHA